MGLFKKGKGREAVEGAIELGDLIRERISGVEGFAYGMSRCAFEAARVILNPQGAKDGKPLENYCADIGQFELLEKNPMRIDVPREELCGMEVGDKVVDQLSGLSGIVIWATTWLYGCCRLTIQPSEAKDGRPAESFTVDAPQAKLLERNPLGIKIPEKFKQSAKDVPVKRSTGGPALPSMRCAETRRNF
jgi:hypothetical protein